VNVLLIPIILAAAFALLFAMAWLEPEPQDPLMDMAGAPRDLDLE